MHDGREEPALQSACEAMATRFEVVASGGDPTYLRAAVDEMWEELRLLERLLSRFRRDSFVNRLEELGHAHPQHPDPEIFELFAACVELGEWTGGAFDIAHRTGGHLILDRELGSVALDRPGMSLDLGAVGKGFAIDRCLALLGELGVESALLHGGTSTVGVLGPPPPTGPWRVAVRGLDVDSIELTSGALSVSAQRGRTLDDGSGHVRDPRSEARPAVPSTATSAVLAPTALAADAWSTALLVDPNLIATAADHGVTVLGGTTPPDPAPSR